MYPVGLVNEACGLESHYRLTAIGADLALSMGITIYRLGADFAEISLGDCPCVASEIQVPKRVGHLPTPFPQDGAYCIA